MPAEKPKTQPLTRTCIAVTLLCSASLAFGCTSSASDTDGPDGAVDVPAPSEIRISALSGFPQTLADGRVRTRYKIEDPTDIWKYRCFQPNRFTDLSDPNSPQYDDADWDHIEFDVIEPANGRTPDTHWMVLLDAGGMSIAEEEPWTVGLDVSDEDAQDEVIMPWPGSLMAEKCSGSPEHCSLYRSARDGDEPNIHNKANEGGMWRAAADHQWLGTPTEYEGLDKLPHNGFVSHLRETKPTWGFVEFSGCARDNLGGDHTDGAHRDRTPWGYEALVAALEFLDREQAPKGLFFTGTSSGGVSTFMAAGRLGAESFADKIVGFFPDSGGADFESFRTAKDDSSDNNNGWAYLDDGDIYARCHSTSWSMSQVFEGVVRYARGFRAQERLSVSDGTCESDAPCLAAPIFLSTTTRDAAIVCGSTEIFADVYGPFIAATNSLRSAGNSTGHSTFIDAGKAKELSLCATDADSECAEPLTSSSVPGSGHGLNGSAQYHAVATDWMECLITAGSDAEARNACARDCVVGADEVVTCLCGADSGSCVE